MALYCATLLSTRDWVEDRDVFLQADDLERALGMIKEICRDTFPEKDWEIVSDRVWEVIPQEQRKIRLERAYVREVRFSDAHNIGFQLRKIMALENGNPLPIH